LYQGDLFTLPHKIATIFLFWGEINCFGLLGDQTNLAFLSIPRLTFNDKKRYDLQVHSVDFRIAVAVT